MSASKPKVFISYSWTSDEYQASVVALARRLVGDEVDVVIDVWDLKAGQDKYAFMERCANDPSIDKVLVLCDARYAEKADARASGVGDIYLPTHLSTRTYVNLSGTRREKGYSKLHAFNLNESRRARHDHSYSCCPLCLLAPNLPRQLSQSCRNVSDRSQKNVYGMRVC